jgi:hypothetical protein
MPKGKFGRGYLKNLTREDLYHMYHEEKMSMHEIADKLNVTFGAIWYWMKKWDIPTRSHDDALILLGKSERFTGEKNPRWTGGRHINPGGYWMIRMPNYPRATNRGYVLEHIYIYEQAHGPIPKGWEVHHINGVKTDNRLENLLAMEGHKHKDFIPALQRRIQELENEIKRLKDERANVR